MTRTSPSVTSLLCKTRVLADLVEIRRWSHCVVFTNGCFDVLHAGHVALLEYAKLVSSPGNITSVVVGLDSDEGVRALKGDGRPVNKFSDRAYVLTSLRFVDHVFEFTGNEQLVEMVKTLRPDVMIKGGDYLGKKIVGAEYARQVKIFPAIGELSSTKVLEKLRERRL